MPSHSCQFCKKELRHTFCNLGSTPLSNAYLSSDQLKKKEPFYPLHVYVCENCFLVQSPTCRTSEEIFTDEYAYFSSYSSTWLSHCQTYAQQAVRRFKLDADSQVIELASNDGYLLQYFKELNIPILGIEPAKNVADAALAKGIPTLTHFFTLPFAKTLPMKADLLIGNNVLAHVPDLNDFVAAMKWALKKEGVISMEFPHVLKLMEENQFDTLYHEHFSYFSLMAVEKIFLHHGLTLFDVETLPTHGGSLRIYAKHSEYSGHAVSSSVQRLLEEERSRGLNRLEPYVQFQERAEGVKNGLLACLKEVLGQNKKIAAYGAPAKGNTLLNFCGLSVKTIPFTVDCNVYKQGKFLPGTHIPIFHPNKILEEKPDFVLILPWNLKNEILHQMQAIRQWGGKFIIPIPKIEIV